MKSEITNLLKSGCIKEVLSDNVYIVSPLSVASNNGKKRLILDLRYLNGFLRVQRFQYEDLRTFSEIFLARATGFSNLTTSQVIIT